MDAYSPFLVAAQVDAVLMYKNKLILGTWKKTLDKHVMMFLKYPYRPNQIG